MLGVSCDWWEVANRRAPIGARFSFDAGRFARNVKMGLEAELWRLCEDGLKAVGYELVELEYVREAAGRVLRVFIDHLDRAESPAGPSEPVGSTITHRDCEQASRHLGAVLDVEDPIGTPYRLEVSSPGVRRPLRKEKDFARFSGQTAQVQLREPMEGRRNFTGRLVSACAGVVRLEVGGVVVELPLDRIRKACLEVEL